VWSARAHEVENVFRCETHYHKWEKKQRNEAQWFPSALPPWELHLCGSCECSEPWLEMKTSIKLVPWNTIRKVLKHRYLKCPRIVHLDMIYMSYEEWVGVKLGIWLPTRNPLKAWIKWGPIGTCYTPLENEVQLECVIHHWKDNFKGYKIFSSHSQNKFDLRKIWTFKILGQQESHLGVLGKSDIWM